MLWRLAALRARLSLNDTMELSFAFKSLIGINVVQSSTARTSIINRPRRNQSGPTGNTLGPAGLEPATFRGRLSPWQLLYQLS